MSFLDDPHTHKYDRHTGINHHLFHLSHQVPDHPVNLDKGRPHKQMTRCDPKILCGISKGYIRFGIKSSSMSTKSGLRW